MKWIVGIDEVGRGALAGPVVVAAAAMPAGLWVRNPAIGTLKDSKKLTAREREAWVLHFKEHPRIVWATARVYPRVIERLNISKAANRAAGRAYGRLAAVAGLGPATLVFLDGGLFLGNGTGAAKDCGAKNVRTVIKGDEKIRAVMIASIVAKVHRDRYMTRLARRHPRYGFEVHKGYGTKMHRRAIEKYGPSAVHRLTFIDQSGIMQIKERLIHSYGRRTSQTSFKRQGGPAAVPSGYEKAPTFRMQELRRAKARAPRLPAMRREVR